VAKVILGTTLSLDGFMDHRIGSVGLLYPDPTFLPGGKPILGMGKSAPDKLSEALKANGYSFRKSKG